MMAAWLPAQPWSGYRAGAELEVLGSYRFDDPTGEVGIETLLLRSPGGPVLQVPLTYRGAPLEGAGQRMVATAQHSVLGARWVYDGAGDSAYAQALATAVLTGGTQALLEVVTPAGLELRPPTTLVSGSGSPGREVPCLGEVSQRTDGDKTVISAGPLQLTLYRVVSLSAPQCPAGAEALVGTWPGRSEPALLACAVLAA